MKTRFDAAAVEFASPRAAPLALDAAAQPGSEPQQPPAETVADHQSSQFAPATRRWVWWGIALAAVTLLLAGNLAAWLIPRYRPPSVASYNSRLADLDTILSRALASRLGADGYEFDAAIVSVAAPACQRAVCLLKRLHRKDGVAFTGEVSARHAGNGTWRFVGTGRLAPLQFDVNAAAEMQRLAESTPPQFQQASPTTPTPNQPEPDARSPFSREFDLWLPATAQEPQLLWLDLETARRLTEPDHDYFVNARVSSDWLRNNGLDLCVVVYPDRSYWICTRGMVLTPVESRLWEQATPDEIISHPGLPSIPRRVRGMISAARSQTDTYLFRTEQGTFGILRLLEINDSSQQVRIRYKLARPAAKADA